MIRCTTCRRHLLATETACPFCSAVVTRRARLAALAAGAVLVAACDVYGLPPTCESGIIDCSDAAVDQFRIPRDVIDAEASASTPQSIRAALRRADLDAGVRDGSASDAGDAGRAARPNEEQP